MKATPAPPDAAHHSERRTHRARSAALILAMSVVSLFMWIGVPLGWLWIAAQVSTDYQAIYLWALFAIPLTMVAVGWVLYRLNTIYIRVSHEPSGPRQTPWLRSQAADRSSSEPRRALDVIMACSVGLAMTLLGVWFFFYAGSPLPGAS
jgi:multisubunit Na+/H+ antiporter MnhB subunit